MVCVFLRRIIGFKDLCTNVFTLVGDVGKMIVRVFFTDGDEELSKDIAFSMIFCTSRNWVVS